MVSAADVASEATPFQAAATDQPGSPRTAPTASPSSRMGPRQPG